ncbi:Scaffold attachment factor B2 [Saguinus oedipus]|uniref:Scaffold attachment factor B2 n=1 Tax=Saguinus oedipus TaxID=9490 RepID=A0ABQ9TSG5_SAGOE|nr:Scaffold attachment factor B2 [Saguinus oedipus]
MFLNRTVIKKEEKIEKKEEKKPEDIKKEEKDQDELKPEPTNRSRVTKSGDESLSSAGGRGRPGTGGSRGMERTVVMDKSKGEPVISVKTTSRSKERVSIASAISEPTVGYRGSMTCLIRIMKTTLLGP